MTIQPGDPNGIAEHNALRADAAAAAALAGVVVDLPPIAVLGQSGHVDAHNKLRAALEAIAAGAGPSWAAASGGTETTISDGGKSYKLHEFLANGTLTVATAGYAEVFLISGGTGVFTPGDTNGGGGSVLRGMFWLPAGALPVVVGAGGASGATAAAVNSVPSSVGDLATAIAGWQNGAGGTPAAPTQGLTSTFTGASAVYGRAGVASPRANSGDGVYPSSAGSGAAGAVYVRIPL